MKQFLGSIALSIMSTTATAQLCDGQYDRAAQLIDETYSRYGTLYSGGPNYGTVGPTLEIYRMLSGLPDAGMSTADRWPKYGTVDPAGYLSDPTFAGETLLRSLPRIHDPDFRKVTAEGATDSEVLLNIYTPIGPYPGWWLTPDAPHLTPVEQVIATYAVDDALDWLLTVQVASARPHSISWHLTPNRTPPAITGVREHAAQRFAETGDLTWFLALLVTREGREPYPAPIHIELAEDLASDLYEHLKTSVTDCTATPADYLAFSIATFEGLRGRHGQWPVIPFDLETAENMPPILRVIAATQLAKQRLARPRNDLLEEADDLRHLANDPAFDRWLNVGLSYHAHSVDDLIEINAGIPFDPKLIRLLNILSADDMIRVADSRDAFEQEQRDLLTTALLRLFALGRDADAAALVDRVLPLWPDHDLATIWNGDGTLGYRLAKLALALPDARTLLVPYRKDWTDEGAFEGNFQRDNDLASWVWWQRGRDLPFDIRSGGYLRRDFRYWMQTVGNAPDGHLSALSRAYRRGLPVTIPDAPFFPMRERSGWHGIQSGPEIYGAWPELAQLGPETGLANRIGRELILNTRSKTDRVLFRWFGDADALAADMTTVISQGRRMIQGDMNGRPLGHVAFALLQGPLADTDIAAETHYWYVCRERCSP